MGVITSGQTLTGKIGVAFSQTPAYTGILDSWAATGLPAGLAINTTSGLISGTPTTKGGATATVSGTAAPTATKIASGYSHHLALKSDGTVVAWGVTSGLAGGFHVSVPAGLSGVVAIAAGGSHSLALKNDGTVVGWGNNSSGPQTIPAGLSGVVAIAAGLSHSLALKSDGTVVGWGNNANGQTTIPAGLSGVTAIAGGGYHSLALKNDGTVVGWGGNANGQRTIPAGLSGVTAIAGGDSHSLALKNDGTVVGWGNNYYGQTSDFYDFSKGDWGRGIVLSGVTAIAAGFTSSIALRNDGTLAIGGALSSGYPYTLPDGTVEATAISFTITDGVPIIAAGQTASGTVGAAFSKTFSLTDTTNRPATSWSATGLPAGLSINASTGAITGTPQDSGSATISLSATGPGGTGTATATISIAVGPPIIVAGQSFTGKVGESFSNSIALEDALDRPATSWARTSGTLPAGLTQNTSTGAITGTPTTKGSFTASFTATGGGGTSAATSIAFTITDGVPIIAAGQTASGTVGTAFSKTFSLTDTTNRPATSWGATGLPAGLSINASTGAITGTPQDSGSATISLTATGPGGSDTETATISIAAGAPIITDGQSFTCKVGVAFSQAPALNDALDRPATSWGVTGLPAGLALNTTTGAITGTPTAKGSFTASFTAANSSGTSAATNISFTIAEGVPIITAGQTASGAVGTAFSKTFSLTDSTNRPVTSWSATGLPSWATLNTSTGAITGTPQDSGSATISLTATGPGGSDTETATISIAAGAPIIQTSVFPDPNGSSLTWTGQLLHGTVGVAFSQTPALVDALNRPATSWLVTSGSLPGGLTLNAATGEISGTPTRGGSQWGNNGGSFIAYFTATGPGGTSAVAAILFQFGPGAPIIMAGQTASGKVGVAFSKTLLLTDNNSTDRPVTGLAATGLPAGLVIIFTEARMGLSSTGAITGTPLDGGEYTASLTATGPGGTDTKTAVISIAAGAPIITAGQSFTGKVGVAFSQTPALEDALDRPATSWSATGLPAGLALNTSTGAITGAPTAKGSFTATFTATGGGGTSAATSLSFTIADGVPIITAGQTASGTVGTAFTKTFSLTDSANRPVTSWSATGLPAGLALNTTTGAITGAPLDGGEYTASLTATGPGGTDTKTAVISIVRDLNLSVSLSATAVVGTSLVIDYRAALAGVTALDAGGSWELYRDVEPIFLGESRWGGSPGVQEPGFVTIDLVRFVWGEFDIVRGFTGRVGVFCFTTLDGRITPEPLVQVGLRFLEGRGAERLQYRSAFTGPGRPFDYVSVPEGGSVIEDEIVITEGRAYGVYNIWATENLPPGQVKVHFSVHLYRDA
jgi:PKD repeat protein